MKAVSGFRTQFLEEGFAGPVPMLTGEECREALTRGYDGTKPPVWPKGLAVAHPYIHRLATKGDLLDLVRELLGENVLLWGARLVHRKPGAEHPWHTDLECSGDTGRTMTVWIGLDGTNRDSSLHVLAHSHQFGQSVQEVASHAGRTRGDVTTEDALAWARARNPGSRVVTFDARDGDALFMDGRLWHYSRNTGEAARTALLLQYCTPDATIRIPKDKDYAWPFRFADERPPCLVVSGVDEAGVNRIAPAPAPDSIRPCIIKAIESLRLKKKKDGWRSGSIFRLSTDPSKTKTSHVSILDEGTVPHDPHSHAEEELLIVLSGQVEIIRADDTGAQISSETLGPGRFVYHPAFHSHTIRGAGPGPATYLMFKWKGEPRTGKREPLQAGTFDIWSGEEKHRDGWKRIRILRSPTLYLKRLKAHLSILEPGAGYPPHPDAYDVAIVVLSGEVETLDHRVGPQSVIYYPADAIHGMRNVGESQAVYLVFEFHKEEN